MSMSLAAAGQMGLPLCLGVAGESRFGSVPNTPPGVGCRQAEEVFGGSLQVIDVLRYSIHHLIWKFLVGSSVPGHRA